MNRTLLRTAGSVGLAWALAGIPAAGRAGDAGPVWAPAVEPKPLSDNVKKGLAWLLAAQRENGGWSQGDESAEMGGGMENVKGVPNVADTCVAALALIRAGSTPKEGEYAASLRRGLDFAMGEIEKSDADSLSVTSVQGTRVQAKLGAYIDTFMASLLLSEAKGRMPDEASEKRLGAALSKVLRKIEKNQRPDGTWDNRGWAPVLAQSIADKGANRAAQGGAEVSGPMLERSARRSEAGFDGAAGGGFRAGGDSAGVALYSGSATLSGLQDRANTLTQKAPEARAILADPAKPPEEKEAARKVIAEGQRTEKSLGDVRGAIVRRLEEPGFVAGFGSNGGEEFLSYMNIGESLVIRGGAEWEKWDKSMAENLDRIQNADGSWSGHHCITGRTFCTAAALLVLMVDRAPVPVAAEIRRR